MTAPRADLVGQVFERLTVLRRVDDERNGCRRYLCRCWCGRDLEVRGANLTSGAQLSCGCMRAELVRTRAELRNRGGLRDAEGRNLTGRARLHWRADRGGPS